MKTKKLSWTCKSCVVCKSDLVNYTISTHVYNNKNLNEYYNKYPLLKRECITCGFKTFDEYTDVFNKITQSTFDQYYVKIKKAGL